MFQTEEIFTQHYKHLVSIANKVLHNRYDAEEVVIDTFIIFMEKRDTIRDKDPYNWLKVVTLNQAKMYYRRNMKCVPIEFSDTSKVELSLILINKSAPPVEDTCLISEQFDQLDKLMKNQLSRLQRKCIIYYYFGNYSYKEIAKKEHIAEGTVKSNISRAKKKLRQSIDDGENSPI